MNSMRSPGKKKQIEEQNLLETTPQAKEEEKTVSEPKVDLPAVEAKTDEVKSEAKTETVLSQSQSNSAPPPISVPISQVETLPADQPPKRKALWVVVFFVFILLVIGGAWMYLSKNSQKAVKKTETKNSLEPTITKTQPTSVASEEAKLDKYPINVLNGSGITGEASELQEILEKGGFEVVETSNADNYDYTDTIIQAKKNVEKEFLEKLKNLIGESYTLGKDESLPASDSSDVVVIVGSKKTGN